MTAKKKLTPMLQQYLAIKEEHQDAILFYRLGDFYEMFFDDAVTASKILGITLTSRNSKADQDRIPLCGIPHHAAPGYLAKLVKAGLKVAICEQIEDPKTAKGVVKRAVVRVITPGMVTDAQLLDDKNNCYLAAIVQQKSGKRAKSHPWGLSLLDLSTGEFLTAEFSETTTLMDELARLAPAELVLPDSFLSEESNSNPEIKIVQDLIDRYLPGICLTGRDQRFFHFGTAKEFLLEHFKTINLAGFGCEHLTVGIAAAGGLLAYIVETQKSDLGHIERLTLLNSSDFLTIDDSSRRNLEISQTIVGEQRAGSLLASLDFCKTPMGARLLKKDLLFPLQNAELINQRLDTVATLHKDSSLRENIRQALDKVYDLERLNSRVVLGTGNGRDLIALKFSLQQIPQIKTLLKDIPTGMLHDIHNQIDELADITTLLEESIREDAPVTIREGKLIKKGYNAELDEILTILKDGKLLIANLESQERQRSGIAKLKIGFNKVFGYFLEVSKGQLVNGVPDYFIRKQTLVNAERFITPELKEFEAKVLGAQEKCLDLEYQLYRTIRATIASNSSRILKVALHLARLDFFTCLAEAAQRYNYVRPTVNNGEEIIIKEGRHPVIEQALPPGRFVPNDIHLDQKTNEVLIITGPNMAGKSTVLRQTALIVLMAQMGSFVPAAKAKIGVVDRIFTRVGAMDNLRKGQSTFMVEMNETANILNNATEKSLVILDEIGRGTSTFDGLAIAWAVTEDLINKNGKGVKTIFATHYHELTELAQTSTRVKNYNIAVREWNDTIIFLHKLMEGGTNRSYGIQVAALAGVPAPVISRAHELLHNIEKSEFNQYGQPNIANSVNSTPPNHPSQLELFAPASNPIAIKLAGIDPNSLSPREALELIYKLKELL